MRILVIEDNVGVREEIVEVLRLEGFTVDEAENGRIGVERVRAQRPDLIICDVMMPELDGFGTLEAVRADPSTSTVPFLFLTARAERQDLRRGMLLGADDYLTKPFTLDELLDAVQAALAKRARIDQETAHKLADLQEQISAALPHELQTPLACIMGYAEMMADPRWEPDRDEIMRTAQRILGAGLRINRLTENSLLYMQLALLRGGVGNANAIRQTQPALLHDVVVKTAREVAAAHRRPDDLKLDLAEARVRMNDGYIKKIAHELLDNAFKFSEGGKPVRVTTRNATDHATLSISDDGRGMTAEQQSAVGAHVQFHRFVAEQQGLGLGLGIAERIAILWGGSLAIESGPRQGTTVTVTFQPSRAIPEEVGLGPHRTPGSSASTERPR